MPSTRDVLAFWLVLICGVVIVYGCIVPILISLAAQSPIAMPPALRTVGFALAGLMGLETIAYGVLRILVVRRGNRVFEAHDPLARPATEDSTIDSLGPFPRAFDWITAEYKRHNFIGPVRKLGWVIGTQDRYPLWVYQNADHTVQAAITYNKGRKLVVATLYTQFEDDASLITVFPKSGEGHFPNFDLESVARVDELVSTHSIQMKAKTHSHGSPLSLPTEADRKNADARTAARNKRFWLQIENRIWYRTTLRYGLFAVLTLGLALYLLIRSAEPGHDLWALVGMAGMLLMMFVLSVSLKSDVKFLRTFTPQP